jgi:hypothetical protein
MQLEPSATGLADLEKAVVRSTDEVHRGRERDTKTTACITKALQRCKHGIMPGLEGI